jgi:hypothetical protein
VSDQTCRQIGNGHVPPDASGIDAPCTTAPGATKPTASARKRVGGNVPYTVTDDWPDMLPVSEAEVALVEGHLFDILARILDHADEA